MPDVGRVAADRGVHAARRLYGSMDLSALHVLVVDDNRHTAEIVKSILEGVGAREIRIATTTHDGFRRLQEEMIDLIILDQNLGAGGAGVDLVRRIRKDPASPNPFVPIIMLTGYADAKLVVTARDCGVSEFLVKPFTAVGLLKRIEALIFQPRPFVRAQDYFGPDRRRRGDSSYDGVERRRRT
jgi:DNA-binding response OmpR family regulator